MLADLCLLFAALIGTLMVIYVLLFAYAWWADYDPLLLGDSDMASKLTESQKKQLAAAVGIDWTKIDWAKVVQIVQLLIAIFAAGGTVTQAKAALKANGCPDSVCDSMCDAIQHNLAAAQDCVQCCCPPTP